MCVTVYVYVLMLACCIPIYACVFLCNFMPALFIFYAMLLGLFTYVRTLEFEAYSYSEREAEEQAERERLRKQWLREQEQIKSECVF